VLFPDVNVCLVAMRPDASPDGEEVRAWLEERLGAHEQVGFSHLVLSAMLRIATNARVFQEPSSPGEAVEFAEALLAGPSAVPVLPGPRHWSLFADLVTTHRLRANDVPDAYLASLAMEAGATLVTMDRGFARFEGLKRLHPLTRV
jgi:toxin-antitoxin system PIN domain toxin